VKEMRQNLRNVRIAKGYKNVDSLVMKLDISASYYYKIEKGSRTPDILLAKKIADVLGQTVDGLFFGNKLDEMSNSENVI